jgi:uncharacterized RDD family membrane protein YckC
MFCSVCGGQVQETDRFCPKCGRAMSPASRVAYAAQPGTTGTMVRRIHYGGFWIRFVAAMVDGAVISIPMCLFVLIIIGAVGGTTAEHFHAIFNGDSDEAAQRIVEFIPAFLGIVALFVVLGIGLQWLYYAMLESSEWQATLGKKILHLQVTDMFGKRMSFARASGRYFGKLLNQLLPLPIGFIIAGFTEKKQALHDFIAGTVVVYND